MKMKFVQNQLHSLLEHCCLFYSLLLRHAISLSALNINFPSVRLLVCVTQLFSASYQPTLAGGEPNEDPNTWKVEIFLRPYNQPQCNIPHVCTNKTSQR